MDSRRGRQLFAPWSLTAALSFARGEEPRDPDPPRAIAKAVEVPGEVEAVLGKGECLTCHVLHGCGLPVGPSLTAVGSRLSGERIREKIVNPAASAVEGYENLAGTMPSDFGERLTGEELDALVRYLSEGR
jgi:mono/diheme cytochrome c family protein